MLHNRWWCIFLHWREVQTSCLCRRTLKLAVCSCYQCCQQTFTFDVEPRGVVEIKLSLCLLNEKLQVYFTLLTCGGQNRAALGLQGKLDGFNVFLLSRYQHSCISICVYL